MRTLFSACILATVLAAGSVLGADSVIPNRLADAKVGEWVLLRDTAGPTLGETERFTVTDIIGSGGDETVVITRERFGPDGELLDSRNIELNVERYTERLRELESKAKQVESETLDVDGGEMTLWSVTWDRETENGQHEYKLWFSDQIPVGGTYKSWSSDPNFSAAEVIDSGK